MHAESPRRPLRAGQFASPEGCVHEGPLRDAGVTGSSWSSLASVPIALASESFPRRRCGGGARKFNYLSEGELDPSLSPLCRPCRRNRNWTSLAIGAAPSNIVFRPRASALCGLVSAGLRPGPGHAQASPSPDQAQATCAAGPGPIGERQCRAQARPRLPPRFSVALVALSIRCSASASVPRGCTPVVSPIFPLPWLSSNSCPCMHTSSTAAHVAPTKCRIQRTAVGEATNKSLRAPARSRFDVAQYLVDQVFAGGRTVIVGTRLSVSRPPVWRQSASTSCSHRSWTRSISSCGISLMTSLGGLAARLCSCSYIEQLSLASSRHMLSFANEVWKVGAAADRHACHRGLSAPVQLR